MGWAEIRIQQYRDGKEATWLEKRFLEHANQVHLVFQVFGVTSLVYGIWAHSWKLITAGFFLNAIGHLYCWLKR